MQVSIRGKSVKLTDSLREYISRRIYFAVGRFAPAIRTVSVRVEDVNGARGGIDKRCYMEVQLRAGRSAPLVVTTDDSNLRASVDRSANRIARKVANELERRQQRRSSRAVNSPPRNVEPIEEQVESTVEGW